MSLHSAFPYTTNCEETKFILLPKEIYWIPQYSLGIIYLFVNFPEKEGFSVHIFIAEGK